MGLFRLIFWLLLIYFAYKAVKKLFNSQSSNTQVKGSPKNKPLDIDESQIKDADFEEMDDK